MNTNSYIDDCPGAPSYEHCWNPGDTTTKECSIDAGYCGQATGFLIGSAFSGSNNATILSRLPNHQAGLNWVGATQSTNHDGTNWIGHVYAAGTVTSSTGIIACRMYVYHTQTGDTYGGAFDYGTNSGCNQSEKFLACDYNGAYTSTSGTRDWWTDPLVMGSQGGQTNMQVDGSQFSASSHNGIRFGNDTSHGFSAGWTRGKWYRVEMWIANPAGTGSGTDGVRIKSFLKNVTDQTDEIKWLDSYSAAGCSTCQSSQIVSTSGGSKEVLGKQTLARYPSGPIRGPFVWDAYRQSEGSGDGACNGARIYSHYMCASWTKAELTAAGYNMWGTDDTSFRIGSAALLEGCDGAINDCPDAGDSPRYLIWLRGIGAILLIGGGLYGAIRGVSRYRRMGARGSGAAAKAPSRAV